MGCNSLKDLISVRAIAIPGAIAQIAVATLLALGLALILGCQVGAGVVFGLSLSVASTVVLLRALQERRLVNTERGRIAVGWLIVEDIVIVLMLVLLPTLVPLFDGSIQRTGSGGFGTLLHASQGHRLRCGDAGAGPSIHSVAAASDCRLGARELFRLGVLVIALGIAFAATNLFGVSFAPGAFFVGMVLSESPLSQRPAEETLPLRNAFAALFFISVGMLFRPMILVDQPRPVLATVIIIVLGKSLAALAIVRAFGQPLVTALTDLYSSEPAPVPGRRSPQAAA